MHRAAKGVGSGQYQSMHLVKAEKAETSSVTGCVYAFHALKLPCVRNDYITPRQTTEQSKLYWPLDLDTAPE